MHIQYVNSIKIKLKRFSKAGKMVKFYVSDSKLFRKESIRRSDSVR